MTHQDQSDRVVSQPNDSDEPKASAPSSKANPTGSSQQELHKPPILLFLLPLVIIIAFAYFAL